MLACAFTQYLLKACCLPEVVPCAGNSNEESDQGFSASHKFYGEGIGGSMHFGAPVSKAEEHVGLAVLRGVAAHVEPLLHGHRAARASLVSAGASPAGRPPPAQPTRGFPHVRWALTLTSARSFHLRPRPRAAQRAGVTVTEPWPRCCCSPIAPPSCTSGTVRPHAARTGGPYPGWRCRLFRPGNAWATVLWGREHAAPPSLGRRDGCED